MEIQECVEILVMSVYDFIPEIKQVTTIAAGVTSVQGRYYYLRVCKMKKLPWWTTAVIQKLMQRPRCLSLLVEMLWDWAHAQFCVQFEINPFLRAYSRTCPGMKYLT